MARELVGTLDAFLVFSFVIMNIYEYECMLGFLFNIFVYSFFKKPVVF